MTMDTEQMTQLEALVDATSLSQVVATLGEICDEKAQHIEVTWQDRPLARLWAGDGDRLKAITQKLNN